MTENTQHQAAAYDRIYSQMSYVLFRRILYSKQLKSIIRRVGLRPGAHVLDVGCGQGYFSCLLGKLGYNVLGVDLSREGIRQARANYATGNVRFEVGDGLQLNHEEEFDAVFARALSSYNVPRLEGTEHVTRSLLDYLKPGGVLIFSYPSNQSAWRKSTSWIHHSLADTQRCFGGYPKSKVYYSIRAVPLPSPVAISVSKLTGIGGELVALIWKA